MSRYRPQPRSTRQGTGANVNANAVIPAPPPDEQTYQMLVEALERRRVRLDRLRAELAETRRQVAAFEIEINARIGDLIAELRAVDGEIAKARQRLQRLLALAGDAGRDVLEQVIEEMGAGVGAELTIDDLAGDPDAFGAPGPAGPAGPAAEDAPGQNPDGDGGHAQSAPRHDHLPPTTRATLRALYRDLARRCHPDLAADPEERARREALMLRVNEAFEAGDADSLRAMLLETESDDPAFAERPVADRLAWARAELARLDRQLDQLRKEMTEAQVSESWRLLRRQEAGEPVLDVLEQGFEVRIRRRTQTLDRLVAAFRSVVSDDRLDEHIDGGELPG